MNVMMHKAISQICYAEFMLLMDVLHPHLLPYEMLATVDDDGDWQGFEFRYSKGDCAELSDRELAFNHTRLKMDSSSDIITIDDMPNPGVKKLCEILTDLATNTRLFCDAIDPYSKFCVTHRVSLSCRQVFIERRYQGLPNISKSRLYLRRDFLGKDLVYNPDARGVGYTHSEIVALQKYSFQPAALWHLAINRFRLWLYRWA